MIAYVKLSGEGKIKEVMEQIETVNKELSELMHLLIDMQELEINQAPDED